jgi:8-oxo-dGTP pyrophosphatase MutT (NUDIX family)
MRKTNARTAQSGVLPYRVTAGKVEVLLVTSTRRKRWIAPKGWIALGLSAAESAAKEALEEAGVSGHVVTPAIETMSIASGATRARWSFFSCALKPCSKIGQKPRNESGNG